jgi:CheY-like chemotaxis protein
MGDAECLRVLIVEDDFEFGEALLAILEDSGHEVQLRRCPASALGTCAGFRPQVGILDIDLPLMSGYELVAALLAMPELAGCRYVALTAHSGRDAVRKSLAAGFEGHFTKPLAFAELQSFLERSRPGQPLSPKSNK